MERDTFENSCRVFPYFAISVKQQNEMKFTRICVLQVKKFLQVTIPRKTFVHLKDLLRNRMTQVDNTSCLQSDTVLRFRIKFFYFYINNTLILEQGSMVSTILVSSGNSSLV